MDQLEELVQLGEKIVARIDAMIEFENMFTEHMSLCLGEISYEYYKQTENLKEIARCV